MNFNIDLKNIDLKNISLEDIQAKLKTVEKKTWIKLGVSIGAVVFFLIIFYGVLNPIVNKKKAQLDDINLAEASIIKIKPKYEQYSTLFHTRAEVEGLYQTLSEYAGANNLIISKIEKKKIEQVSKSAAMAKATGKQSKVKATAPATKANTAYYTIPVDFEIKGNFLGYIKFKRQISLSQKMLNFDKESIKVVKGDTTGAIIVNGTLTIVGLTDEFF